MYVCLFLHWNIEIQNINQFYFFSEKKMIMFLELWENCFNCHVKITLKLIICNKIVKLWNHIWYTNIC